MPDEDLRARLAATIEAFAALQKGLDEFVAAHRQTINDYHDFTHAAELPDGVWQLVDKVTGYHQWHIDLYNFGGRLEDLADGKLRGDD